MSNEEEFVFDLYPTLCTYINYLKHGFFIETKRFSYQEKYKGKLVHFFHRAKMKINRK